jgi:hypothetical protein
MPCPVKRFEAQAQHTRGICRVLRLSGCIDVRPRPVLKKAALLENLARVIECGVVSCMYIRCDVHSAPHVAIGVYAHICVGAEASFELQSIDSECMRN